MVENHWFSHTPPSSNVICMNTSFAN